MFELGNRNMFLSQWRMRYSAWEKSGVYLQGGHAQSPLELKCFFYFFAKVWQSRHSIFKLGGLHEDFLLIKCSFGDFDSWEDARVSGVENVKY